MAQMEGLYIGLGIDTSQLSSDFVDAEKTINQNLAQLNKEMRLVQIKGQIELEGLEESASSAEKLRIQEEALNAQINLQKDKIILLAATYEHLLQTRGESADVTKQAEYQLVKEQLAMQRLENQLDDLSKQEEIALGINYELLALIEPAMKGIEGLIAAGHAMPIPHAKATAATGIALLAVAEGSREATEELREENPAIILDESFKEAAVSIDDSWQRISESTKRSTAQMQANIDDISSDSGLKIFPDFNEVDFIRFIKIMENFRPSESIVNTLELIKQSDSLIGKFLSLLVGVTYIASTIDVPTIEIAQRSIDSFRELSKAANELNLPLERANELVTKINLSGAEYNDVRDYVRGVQDAVIKGDSEDPEVLALEKYGVVIQDAQGKLLAFDETLENLYQGYLKAREAGEAEAYVMMTNGQSVQDVLPYFEKLAQAEKDMARIKWSTVDAATLEEASHNMKLVETQTNELKTALSSLAVPAANMALERSLDFFKMLTELIEENREEIIFWTFALMEGVGAFQDYLSEQGSKAIDKLKELEEEYKVIDNIKSLFAEEPTKDLAEEAKENLIPFYKELKKLEEEFGLISKVERILPEGFAKEIDEAINEYLVPFYQKIKDIEDELSITNKLKSFLPEDLFGGDTIFDSILSRAKDDLEEFKKVNEEAREETEQTTNDLAGLSYSLNRIAKYKSELETVNFDIRFGSDSSYEKTLAQNKLWYDTAMKDAKQYADEKAVIEELYEAKIEQIEQERASKLAEIREQIAYANQTEVEKRIADIEREKETWIQAGMEKVEAERLAQQQLSSYLLTVNRELEENILAINQTGFEKRLAQIEKEKQAWLQKGADIAQAERFAQEEILKAQQEREKKLDEIRESVAALDRSDLENKLAKIETEKEAWIEAGMERVEAEELAQRRIQNLYEETAEENRQEAERVASENRRAEENAKREYQRRVEEAERRNKALRDEAWSVLKSQAKEFEAFLTEGYAGLQKLLYKNLIKSGVNPEHLAKMTPDKLRDYKSAKEKAMNSFLPNWYDPYSANPVPVQQKSPVKIPLPNIQVPEGASRALSDLGSEAAKASDSLSSFPKASQAVEKSVGALNELPPAVKEVVANSSVVLESFSGMAKAISEVTVRIEDLSTALQNIYLPKENTSRREEQAPVVINNNTSIREAHAWDYSHIQELADKVAEVITPKIMKAMGGGYNSY